MADRTSQPCPDYLEPYQQACAAFGPSFEATLWASREWQEARFRVMTELFQFAGQSVVDAGAGQGDFAAHLLEKGVAFSRMTGLEAVPGMLESARARKLARCEFLPLDFVAQDDAFARTARDGAPPDAIVFSGSLNTLNQDEALRVLDRAWEACGSALLFNFLSARVGPNSAVADTGPARRFDPLAIIAWALERTPLAAYRQDYIPHGHDATVLMRKDR